VSDQTYAVPAAIAAHANVTAAQFQSMTDQATRDPQAFWAEQSKRIAWIKPPTQAMDASFEGDVHIRWYEDGTLNASASCLDQHLTERPDQVAIIWEGDDPGMTRSVTYRELHAEVCRFSNALKGLGVKRGDRITIYLPMVVEAAVAMLACARLGAIHAIVFGGFSPDSLANRIQDCDSTVLITADEGRRGGRKVALKANADAALTHCPSIQAVVVVKVTGGNVPMVAGRDHDYAKLIARVSAGGNARGRSAVHSLHQRQHGQTEGRGAHHWRLYGLGRLHA